MANPERLERVLRRNFQGWPPCARCGHSFAQHNTPGNERIEVIGHDHLGEVFCQCTSYEVQCTP